MVIKDFYVGDTRIIIDDEYCDKTAEETKQRLDRIAYKAYENMVAYAYNEQKKKRSSLLMNKDVAAFYTAYLINISWL